MSGWAADTVRFERVGMSARHARAAPRAGWFWRGVAGALAVGLALLALALFGAEALASDLGVDGPGAVSAAAHAVAAAVCFAAVRIADRADRSVAAAAVGVVLLVSGATLWWFWWS